MLEVKFFGSARMKLGVSVLHLEAKNIKDLLRQIASEIPEVTVKELKNFFIYVNNININELKKYRTELSEGDKIMFLSPASGG